MAKKKVKLDEEEAKMDMSPMIDCVNSCFSSSLLWSHLRLKLRLTHKVKPTIAVPQIQESNIGRIVVNAY